MPSANQIVRCWKNLPAEKKEMRKLQRQLAALMKKLDRKEDLIRDASAVDEVYKGVPIYGPLKKGVGGIWPIGDDRKRYANFWRNAHTNSNQDWRFELMKSHNRIAGAGFDRVQYITGLTRQEVILACKEWVACGKKYKKGKR